MILNWHTEYITNLSINGNLYNFSCIIIRPNQSPSRLCRATGQTPQSYVWTSVDTIGKNYTFVRGSVQKQTLRKFWLYPNISEIGVLVFFVPDLKTSQSVLFSLQARRNKKRKSMNQASLIKARCFYARLEGCIK